MVRRIAVATNGTQGLEDTVSTFFGRANTFTIVDLENTAKIVKVFPNPSVPHKPGTGRIVVKSLANSGVNLVIAGEIGPGASQQLSQYNIDSIIVRPETKVAEAIKKVEIP